MPYNFFSTTTYRVDQSCHIDVKGIGHGKTRSFLSHNFIICTIVSKISNFCYKWPHVFLLVKWEWPVMLVSGHGEEIFNSQLGTCDNRWFATVFVGQCLVVRLDHANKEVERGAEWFCWVVLHVRVCCLPRISQTTFSIFPIHVCWEPDQSERSSKKSMR